MWFRMWMASERYRGQVWTSGPGGGHGGLTSWPGSLHVEVDEL